MDTVLFFRLLEIVAIAVLFFLFVYTQRQKPSQMQKYASLLIINTILMLVGSLMEMQAETVEGALYGTVITYIGQPFLLVFVFLFICNFYGVKIPRVMFIAMLAVAAFISVSVITNPLHYLYYSNVGYDPDGVYTHLLHDRGPLYIVNIATVVIYNIGVIVVTIRGYLKSKSPYKRKLSFYSLLMMVSAIAGFVAYSIDIANGYDTTMLGLFAGTIFLCILFFRCKVFDVVDMAKDYALDSSQDGLLIYDDTGAVVYQNVTAQKVVDNIIPKEFINDDSDEKKIYKNEDSVYSINTTSIKHKDEVLGKSVEIYDITESHNYSQRLEKAVAEATEKLESIQRTIFGSFASLVEARSIETGDHIKRVSEYTEMMLNVLKEHEQYSNVLTDNYINTVVASAPLHDIGKISVSDSILLKPGPFDEHEYAEMKKHSEAGAKIIRSTMGGLESEDYVKMATEIAMYHHEWYDGTGYPKGLKGREIPLAARIVAIADCYDAMTSERCYKEAFPSEEAIAIIKQESGTHFDPELVEIFVNLHKD